MSKYQKNCMYMVVLAFIVLLMYMLCKPFIEGYEEGDAAQETLVPPGSLKATIVVQKQEEGGRVPQGQRNLLHFTGTRLPEGNYDINVVEPGQGVFEAKDVVFINNHYKGPEGKKLVTKFLANPEKFPTHMDIDKAAKTNFAEFDNDLLEAQESLKKANENVANIETQLQEVTKDIAAKTALSSQYKNQISSLEEQIRAAQAAKSKSDELAEQETAKLSDTGYLLGKFFTNLSSGSNAPSDIAAPLPSAETREMTDEIVDTVGIVG